MHWVNKSKSCIPKSFFQALCQHHQNIQKRILPWLQRSGFFEVFWHGTKMKTWPSQPNGWKRRKDLVGYMLELVGWSRLGGNSGDSGDLENSKEKQKNKRPLHEEMRKDWWDFFSNLSQSSISYFFGKAHDVPKSMAYFTFHEQILSLGVWKTWSIPTFLWYRLRVSRKVEVWNIFVFQKWVSQTSFIYFTNPRVGKNQT